MKTIIAAACLLLASTHLDLAVADCTPVKNDEVEQVRKALDSVLPDAPTARFKDVCLSSFGTKLKPQQKVYCGLLNQKNSFGAFVGYRKFGYISGGTRVPAIVSGKLSDIAVGSPERAFVATYCTLCEHDDECKHIY